MSNTDEDDYPEIDDVRCGRFLACRGDDSPEEFTDWLKDMISEFEELQGLAKTFGCKLDTDLGSFDDCVGFCEYIGISFDSSFWESSFISGTYLLGWLEVKGEDAAQNKGEQLLAMLRKVVDKQRKVYEKHQGKQRKVNEKQRKVYEKQVRREVLSELRQIENFNEFMDRTANDRTDLRNRISKLQDDLYYARVDLETVRKSLKSKEDNDTKEIDDACLRLAGAIIAKESGRFVAGPLVLWDDGVVYAITSRGGVQLPVGSSPDLLLKALGKLGQPIVTINEMTVIGIWHTYKYRKGAEHINGWKNIWSEQEKEWGSPKYERTFIVEPPEFRDKVYEIHEILKGISEQPNHVTNP